MNVSASLPAGLKFMTSATGTSKNQYNSNTGLWQVDNLKMSSQGAGKKTLNVTAEVLPEASGRLLTATAVFLSVSNSSGELPLKSAQSQLTIESNKTNNGENTGNTGSTSSSTTSTSVTTTPVSKTSLVAAKLKDNNNNNSTNPLNLPQDNPGKAYAASNSTENSNTNVPMSTYALVALGGIGIVIVVGYYLGTRKKI